MTLKELSEKVRQSANNPHALAELSVEIAGLYAYSSEDMRELQLAKASFLASIKFSEEKVKSDSYCEAKWLTTEEGKMEIRLKYTMRAYEKLLSAIKSAIVVASTEARLSGN